MVLPRRAVITEMQEKHLQEIEEEISFSFPSEKQKFLQNASDLKPNLGHVVYRYYFAVKLHDKNMAPRIQA